MPARSSPDYWGWFTRTTQTQARAPFSCACACVVPVHTWLMLALVLASYVQTSLIKCSVNNTGGCKESSQLWKVYGRYYDGHEPWRLLRLRVRNLKETIEMQVNRNNQSNQLPTAKLRAPLCFVLDRIFLRNQALGKALDKRYSQLKPTWAKKLQNQNLDRWVVLPLPSQLARKPHKNINRLTTTAKSPDSNKATWRESGV